MKTFANVLKSSISGKAVDLGFDANIAAVMADRWWQFMTDSVQLDLCNNKDGLKVLEHYFDDFMNKKDKWSFLIGLFDWYETPEGMQYWGDLANS